MKEIKTLIFFTILLISISTNAQKIEGIYRVDDIEMVVSEIGMTYSFGQDGTFRRTLYEHLEMKTIAGGVYELVGDTLKLHYTTLKKTPPNPINIVKKRSLKSSSDSSFNPMFSGIKVLDSNGNPQPGVHLVLQNKEKKPVMAFTSDSSGNFPRLYIYDKYITALQISFLGYQETYIQTDTLFNYETNIEVRLNQSIEVYENVQKTITYLIKKRTSERLELVLPQADDTEKLVLIKTK